MGIVGDRVQRSLARLAEADRPEVWIRLRDPEQLRADAVRLDAEVGRGAELPLAGLLVAVKDNVDVRGLPTTAGCPEYAYEPTEDAPAIARLIAAGALVLGKTNLDQFATGLVGTRSPYGAVRNAVDPAYVSGGSSSGSAVAVALGIVDIGIGTDTAGSGRVPAAFNGLVGVKATLGLVPTTGVVPASRSFDAVTVLARDLVTAADAMRVMIGPDSADPRSRRWPDDVRLSAPAHPVVAVPTAPELEPLSPAYRAAFESARATLVEQGVSVREVDVTALIEVARLLYDGALVAERFAAVGEFIRANPSGVDPTVRSIVLAAEGMPAHRFVADLERVERARRDVGELLGDASALMLPTTTEHPTIAQVQADPIAVNRRLGTYTNFVNLLDLAAVAVPAGTAQGLPFGVTFVSRAFDDQLGLDVARSFGRGQAWASGGDALIIDAGVDLAVFGAHLSDQPLNSELLALGGRLIARILTAPAYRLLALATQPPKPGLVRVGDGGSAIRGELWRLPVASLGRFLAALPAPMMLGPVELAGGRWVVGFGCSDEATSGGVDITSHGGWASYLAATGDSARFCSATLPD
ncbi:MAG TPA: allophanate hydrolase [Gryllotalpicola sp.]